MKEEIRRARDAGLDTAIIGEYRSPRRNIDFDTRMLAVLKIPNGINNPGKDIMETDRTAVSRLEDNVKADEARPREITALFADSP